MSLFSKIGKGLKTLKKKVTLKSALGVGAAVGALALPGVGTAVVAGIKGAGSLIGRGGVAAGKIVRSAGSAAAEAASGISGGINEASDTLVETSGDLATARDRVTSAVKRGAQAVGEFQASGKAAATEGAVLGALQAVPVYIWIGAAALVIFLMVKGRK